MDYMLEQLQQLLSIDSPTGYTKEVATYVCKAYKDLGYDAHLTVKGGVFVDLGPVEKEPENNALLLEAHVDTLGAMVATIKDNGRLRLTPLGGMNPNNAEAENCRVFTRNGKTYEGTFQLVNASIHNIKFYVASK